MNFMLDLQYDHNSTDCVDSEKKILKNKYLFIKINFFPEIHYVYMLYYFLYFIWILKFLKYI